MGKEQPEDITKAWEREILWRERMSERENYAGGTGRVGKDAASWQGSSRGTWETLGRRWREGVQAAGEGVVGVESEREAVRASSLRRKEDLRAP